MVLTFFQSDTKEVLGQALPERGQVDMICAGTPCQGFSRLNRSLESDDSVRNVSTTKMRNIVKFLLLPNISMSLFGRLQCFCIAKVGILEELPSMKFCCTESLARIEIHQQTRHTYNHTTTHLQKQLTITK
jgi:hypothetical protein